MNPSRVEARSSVLRLPSGQLALDRARIMGILNVTPDSFYDRGRYFERERAVARASEMVEEGADIVEIGGEKAGSGAPVSADEEMRRVVPVIEAVRRSLPNPVSVDTFKPEVARAAAEAGAEIINSIGGFTDSRMRRVAAESGCAIVIMHIKGRPRVANPDPSYRDVVGEVIRFLEERVRDCVADGITPDRIVVDPGPGFGKTARHDLALLRDISRIADLPHPVLLAVSRKRFIGELLDADAEGRLMGSLAVTAWGVLQGVRLVRTHDVRATVRVVRMIEAVEYPDTVPESPP